MIIPAAQWDMGDIYNLPDNQSLALNGILYDPRIHTIRIHESLLLLLLLLLLTGQTK